MYSLFGTLYVEPSLQSAYELWRTLYDDLDGHALSADHGSGPWDGFSYGEICFESFSELLNLLQPRPGGTFYDLGSGTGKAVLAAALGKHGFVLCYGIELVPALHEAACHLADQVTALEATLTDEDQAIVARRMHSARFVLGDISTDDIKWEEHADTVFANNLRLPEDVNGRVAQKACRLKTGSKILTTRELPDCENFLRLTTVVHYVKMTFGRVTVFVYERVPMGSTVQKETYWYGRNGGLRQDDMDWAQVGRRRDETRFDEMD